MRSVTPEQASGLLHHLFAAAVERAKPGPAIGPYLPAKPTGRCIVIGAGKASAAMAAAVEAAWPDVALSGVVVTRYGHAVPTERIRILEAAHPVSDAMSETAALLILDALKGLTQDDLVLALISGGGSALMALPAAGITLADKQAITRQLLRSGATIHEMNAVRKRLSAVKGGKLALAAQPARLVTLAISDIPGDAPADIASGPTVLETAPALDARAILQRYRIHVSDAVNTLLEQVPPPQPDLRQDIRLIATPSSALEAAAQAAREQGITPLILGDALEGESAQLGIFMAGIARSIREKGLPFAPPVVLLSGGETTVTLGEAGAGKGGRNTEFLLSFACAAKGLPGVWAIAGDTDGIDGSEDAAGAWVTPDTLTRADALGLAPADFLQRHDSYSLFSALGDLVITGPTLTNVNDVRAVLVL
ncbi:glycerate kinase [Enterobacterales bacterium CwR94]|nr:glycerate kinase [Enterobacterales bacterium CwR94]